MTAACCNSLVVIAICSCFHSTYAPISKYCRSVDQASSFSMSKAPSKRLADLTLGKIRITLSTPWSSAVAFDTFRKIQDSHGVVEFLLQNGHDPLKHLPRCFHVRRLPDHPKLGVKLRSQLFWAGVQGENFPSCT